MLLAMVVCSPGTDNCVVLESTEESKTRLHRLVSEPLVIDGKQAKNWILPGERESA